MIFLRKLKKSAPVWVEIDLKRLRNNLQVITGHLEPETQILAVLKSNAYGHGSVQIALELQRNGIAYFAVARLEEALELRRAGIKGQILLFEPIFPEQMEMVVENHVIPSVVGMKSAELLVGRLRQLRRKIKIHLKIDSGMGGPGLLPEDCREMARFLKQQKRLEIDGVYTHLTSDYRGDSEAVRSQLEQFRQAMIIMEQEEIHVPHIHVASSLAIFTLPETHYNMVRPGISLYGIPPKEGLGLPLQPVMQVKSRILYVKELHANESIGTYGSKFTASHRMQYAVVTVGYGDAFFLLTTRQGSVLVRGRRASMISQSRMNQILIDVTHISDVSEGDEVVLIGEQGMESITAEDATKAAGIPSINCESVCLINPKVPRYFLGSRQEWKRNSGAQPAVDELETAATDYGNG
ncbi:MAG TPA: alanine racemase [Firmicutes bacterium]|nr:alanine racemase [Bacillota bacterium]